MLYRNFFKSRRNEINSKKQKPANQVPEFIPFEHNDTAWESNWWIFLVTPQISAWFLQPSASCWLNLCATRYKVLATCAVGDLSYNSLLMNEISITLMYIYSGLLWTVNSASFFKVSILRNKFWGHEEIWNHDLPNTGQTLYPLSKKDSWENELNFYVLIIIIVNRTTIYQKKSLHVII